MEGETEASRGFEFPGEYYEIIRRDFRDVDAEVAFLESYLPSGGAVLDIGCGTGTVLRPLAQRGFSCAGVDQSTSFIAYAQRVGGGPNYHVCSAHEFETDDRFDVIVAMFVTLNYLSHEEVRATLRRCRRWLRPGGALIVDMAHLLNFIEDYRPYIIAHHYDGNLVITRLIRHLIWPHEARWRHDESILVAERGQPVTMYHNGFDQIVLTVPELESYLDAAGFTLTERFANFRKAPPHPLGRGHLILVARADGPFPT